jgi:hypothetical protein
MNYDMNKEPSYVYILTSTSFRGDWVNIGRELSCQLNIDPAIVLGV